MMTITQVMNRSLIAAIAILNVSAATQAIASPQIINRGPNGASFITTKKATHSETQMSKESKSVKTNQHIITRGPNGAGFIKKGAVGGGQFTNESARMNQRVITRGPNGAGFVVNR